jgi:hypothetical protein
VTQPIVGWRIWRVRNELLCATVWGTPWWPQVRVEPVCQQELDHAAPQRDCECGVYAFKSREDAAALAREKVDHDVIALGRVSLWGRVIETERGYRAAHAYPYDIELLGGDDSLAAELRGRYAIDVTTAPAVVPLHSGGG